MASTAAVSVPGTTFTAKRPTQPLARSGKRSSQTPSQRSGSLLSLSSLDRLCGLCIRAAPPAHTRSRWSGGASLRAREGARNATAVKGTEAREKPVKLKPGEDGNIVESQHGAYVVYQPTIAIKRRVGRSILPSDPKQKKQEAGKKETAWSEDEETDGVFLERKESKLAGEKAKRRAREGYLEDDEEEAIVGSERKVVDAESLQDNKGEPEGEEQYFRGQSDVRLDYDIRPVVDRIREEGLEVMALFVDKLGVRDMDRILLRFGTRGEWNLALRVFEWMLKDRYLQPDQKTYTIMMDILGTNKQPQLAEEMFQSMQEEGLVDTRACNVLLNAYAQVGQSKQASALFMYMKQQGMRLDAYSYSSVIKALSRDKGKMEQVLDLFKEMQAARISPTSVIYSQLIETLGSAGYVDQAETTFKQMQRSGVAAELIAYNSLLAAYTRNHMTKKVEALFEELKDAGFEPSKHTYSTVMNAYGSAGDLESAERVFEEYLDSSQVQQPGPHNTMMGIYARRGDLTKALQIFVGMNERGASPNDVSSVIILSSLVRARKLNEAEQLYETIRALEIPHSTQLWNAVIHMYGKAGKVDKARAAFEAMRAEGFRPNEVTNRELAVLDRLEKLNSPAPAVNGTALPRVEQLSVLERIEKAAHEGNLREALEVLRAAVKEPGAAPEAEAFTAFFRACERSGEWEPASEMFAEMKKLGVQPTRATYSAILNVYAKLGELPRAEAVFQEMRDSGVIPMTGAYNIRLNGYGRMRDFEAMESFFAEMQVSGVALDEVTFNTMITHYARTQQYEAVLDTVERMQEAGLRPSDVTNGILMRHCNVSPDQLQIALQQGTFRGVIPEEVYARQHKLRRPRRERRVAGVTEGVQPEESSTEEASTQGRAEESAPRMGSEAQVDDEPSSSAAAEGSEWLRSVLDGLEASDEVHDAVRWSGPDAPLQASSLRDRILELVQKEGPESKWKLTSFNSLLYALADNLHMRSALHIFDKMLERNIPLKKKASMKLLENLARTRYTQDVLRVRSVCEKLGIQSFIYVSEAVERELERAGQLAAH